MGICNLFFSEIKKGSVFEIKGNFAEDDDYDKLRSDKAQWDAPKYYPSAYIGQIVVDDGGFFRGWLIDNHSSEVEHFAIVGRFLKGRNDRVDMLFSTIDNDCYKFWMKKKLHKMSDFGVVNSPRYYYEEWDDAEEARYENTSGYFTIEIDQCFADAEEKEQLVKLRESISVEHNRLISLHEDLPAKAKEFKEKFGSIKEFMLDLYDLFEDEKEQKEIKYP